MKVGFTGDPYSGCVDIDECASPDLNTCAGGLNPRGVDADLTLDDTSFYNYYLGEPGADGFTQVKLLFSITNALLTSFSGPSV